MRFLLATAAKDLRRRARDPISLLVWVGIPALLALMLGAVSPGEGEAPRAEILIADRDSSVASRLLIGAAGSGRIPANVTETSPEAGRGRMEEGEASALVVLPEGFGAALVERPDSAATPEVTVVTNPEQRVLPRLAVEGVETLGEAAFFARELLGGALREVVEGPPDGGFFGDQRVAGIASAVNARLRGVEEVLFPPVLDLEVATRGGGTEEGFARLLLPGLVFMALLLMGEGLAGDLWQEVKSGAMTRWRSSPRPLWTVLGGKLLAAGVVAAAVGALGFGAGAVLVELPLTRLPWAVAWSAAAVTCLVPFFYLLHLSASGQRGGNLVSNMVLFPMLMLGGSFFPFEAMPGWMADVGVWLPNGRAVVVLREVLAGTAGFASVAATGGALLVFGAAAFAATVAWLPRRFAAAGGGAG